MQIVLVIWLFLLGAALGSFSLVLAWRMHDKKDWVRGRSKCDACGHELKTGDLIPVFSWLALRGQCRYCKKRIPGTVFVAEIFLGLIVAGSWAVWPLEISSASGYVLFGVWVLICCLMSALFWYDLRWFILPNKLVYSLLSMVVVFVVLRFAAGNLEIWDGIVLPLIASALLFGLFFVLHAVSGGKWIGFGDVRLAVPLGLLVGSPLQVWLMLFTASAVGLMVSLPSLMKGRRKLTSKIPFGPLLIIAAIAIVLFGQDIVVLYKDFIGI